jgi:Transglutaminase-like superfamily
MKHIHTRIQAGLRLAIFVCGAAAPLAAFGQFQAPSQDELKMTSDPKAPGADAVYLYREEREEDDLHYREVYVRIKVLTEKGKELATVNMMYQRSIAVNESGNNRQGEDEARNWNIVGGHFEVTAISGRTIHSDGTIIPMTTTAADLMAAKSGATQFNSTTFNLPSVEVGSILEYRYQLRYDRFLVPPTWQVQQRYFVHKAHYMLNPPSIYNPKKEGQAGSFGSYMVNEYNQVLSDLLLTANLPPGKRVQQDPTGRWILDVTDIPAIPQEAHAPPYDGQIYQVEFYYTTSFVQKDYWLKAMQVWTRDVNTYTSATDSTKRFANEESSDAATQLDKAKKLYAFVQKFENTDYSGKFSFFGGNDKVPPGNISVVLEKKSGTSKEIALAYLGLARAAGLNARPERIASRNHRFFSADQLSTNQLDYIVIAVNVDGKELVLDPGEKLAPFQTLGWAHAGAGGVAMTGDGKVETIITPLAENAENKTIRVGTLTVTPQGSVSGTLKVGYTGQEALRWRQFALRNGAEEMKSRLENVLGRQVPEGIQLRIDHIAGQDYTSNQLVAVVQITGSLANRTGTKLILPRLFFESKEVNPFPADTTRFFPVDMQFAAQEQDQITYTLPAGYTLGAAPEDVKFTWENNAAYQLKSKADATSVVSARVFARGFTLLEAKEYGALRDFYQKVTTADQQQLVLSPQSASR